MRVMHKNICYVIILFKQFVSLDISYQATCRFIFFRCVSSFTTKQHQKGNILTTYSSLYNLYLFSNMYVKVFISFFIIYISGAERSRKGGHFGSMKGKLVIVIYIKASIYSIYIYIYAR